MKKFVNKLFIIGISVIAALVILFFGIDYLKGINLFKPANFYYVSYDNVAGLEIAAPVTIDGYKVGQVREINFDYTNHGKIVVLLALNKKLSVPSDSYATIESGMLSGASINLVLGKSDRNIEVGGEIPTAVSHDLMATLSNDLLPQINNILPKIDSILQNLNTLTSDPALLQSIQRLDGITANINTATIGLNRTMNQQIPGIMGNAGRITHNLDTITTNLALLSAQLKDLPLQTTMANVETTTANLSKFSDQINSNKSTLGLLTQDPELYNRLNRVTADIDSLILDIKKNPKRYISIKLL